MQKERRSHALDSFSLHDDAEYNYGDEVKTVLCERNIERPISFLKKIGESSHKSIPVMTINVHPDVITGLAPSHTDKMGNYSP